MNFTTASCGLSATAPLACISLHRRRDHSNADITHTARIFTAVTQNHGDCRKSWHTEKATMIDIIDDTDNIDPLHSVTFVRDVRKIGGH